MHTTLLLLTLLSTTFWGGLHYEAFQLDFVGTLQSLPPMSELMPRGLWYSATILLILGAHELGHYLACRYYNVDASLPYFLPAPVLTGTFGAFIKIREPFPTKAILFDIGAAGPIAGFLVTVPALLLGLSLSRVVPLPEDFAGYSLGEPLLFRGAAWLLWGTVPDGYSLNLHPIGFAAWFGLFATAVNLLPFGQLDGGHIAYAVLGRRSMVVSVATVAAAIGLTFFSASWLVMTVLLVLMLVTFGARHPRTLDEHAPLDPTRRRLAFATLVMFVVCFTPAPIELYELIKTP